MTNPPARPPATENLTRLKRAARNCHACPLYKCGTQTVFGEGSKEAGIMLVGEQPGDKEDRSGHPFVGPAGALLNEILEELGIPREQIFVTNAVKHFKWRRAGKIRLHQKPNTAEIEACHPWLESEVNAVKPGVIVCLGATAVRSVLGKPLPVTANRGKFLAAEFSAKILVSWHPSAILRGPTPEARAQKRAELRADLARAWRELR